ncbi:MAG: hydrolase [Deltaproteobacteria bacterium RIFOXYD12_FULL_57_12]|nr:MAG: hydrolase [Deltaproteobacteria bacterium RIFOXYD12_FULL_57_12]
MKSKIVLLGTGTPIPDPTRHGTSVAIVVNRTSYIVDFGPGVVRRAVAAYQSGVAGLRVKNLRKAFVTHLHSDHTAGYPDIILAPGMYGRSTPLEVYGPRGLQAMTDHILAAYEEDINERIHGLEKVNQRGYQVNVHEIKPGLVYQDQNVRVEAFRVRHGSFQAFGYKFHTPDRVIVISGDTAPFTGWLDIYQGCDVLIHEVQSAAGLRSRPPMWQSYHSRMHTSTIELAEIATKAKPGLLILYHQLFHGVSEEDLLREVQERYTGKVVSGKDLEVY